MTSAYSSLEAHFRKIAVLESASALLEWDSAVIMPSSGAETRGEQNAAIQSFTHELRTDPRLGEQIGKAESETGLNDWQMANLLEMKRKYIHARAVPQALVARHAKAAVASEQCWREARKTNNFNFFSPHLTEMLGFAREVAEHKAEALKLSPYDALLDQYDPGLRMPHIDALFSELAAFLKDFLPKVAQKTKENGALHGHFDLAKQETLAKRCAAAAGFDFSRGRMDVSTHPFSMSMPQDIRITTRYDEKNFLTGLMSTMHETGHAMYDFGLPQAWVWQPVGDARGMSIHESQSLLLEMQACRTDEFMKFLAPLAQEVFGMDISWETLRDYFRRVVPGFIRVDADEVTYPLHIMLRYRLEKDLLSEKLAVRDLPEAWNEGMREFLGIVPATDREGCLQDIHWSDGTLGYFPTYSLGAMTAAQMFQAAKRSDSSILPSLERGDFKPLYAWLRTHVHGVGSRYATPELIERATGAPLSAKPYINHLTERYGA